MLLEEKRPIVEGPRWRSRSRRPAFDPHRTRPHVPPALFTRVFGKTGRARPPRRPRSRDGPRRHEAMPRSRLCGRGKVYTPARAAARRAEIANIRKTDLRPAGACFSRVEREPAQPALVNRGVASLGRAPSPLSASILSFSSSTSRGRSPTFRMGSTHRERPKNDG